MLRVHSLDFVLWCASSNERRHDTVVVVNIVVDYMTELASGMTEMVFIVVLRIS